MAQSSTQRCCALNMLNNACTRFYMSMSRKIVPTANIRIMFDTTGSANWTKSIT